MKFLSLESLAASSLLRVFCNVVIFILCQYNGAAKGSLPFNETVPAVFVFGDSIVDPGNNNNNIKTVVKCNFPPYGKDFPGGNSTGRFSNGRVPSDIIAEIFNVKNIVPAYLDPNLQLKDLLTGVSFASGGGGYDPLTAEFVSVLSLSDQLEMFREYKSKLKAAVGEKRLEMTISKSIFIVCSGTNDIANTYFLGPFRRPHYDIQAYTDLMANSASSFLQGLYGEGARRIGVVSLPPIGCVPAERTLSGDIFRHCSEPPNQAASLFNSKLSSLMDSLNVELPQARLVYLDIYNPLISIIQNPPQYGFEVATKGCCGTGNIEVSILCNRYTTTTCSNASKYIFWDSYHPSQKGYEVLTHLVLHNKIDRFF
ncbi:GDSL esterase/lipase EXL3 isoform X1 [Morus notabilis]|uniref:GDSL esterase/lipase EXL3 isoform X1 n=1 Tax=Morus notabilis TaxID=981085 RepID=UPI000CECE629|nr:GDSL esterase/lipase EXL3 isoform X1 [Morus notabilis]